MLRKNDKSYKEFYSSQEADEWARRLFSTEILSDEEKEAIGYYCGTGYHCINIHKRRIPVFNPLSPRDRKWADITISNAILKAPRIPENIIVYRKITYNTIAEHWQEKKLAERSFLSTCFCFDTTVKSIDCDIPWCILRILVPKGTAAFYTTLIKDRGESELLINENHILVFMKRYHRRHEYVDNEKILVIECRLEHE